MVSLARTSAGLLYRSDGSLAGWTNGGQWTSVADLALVPFGALPPAFPGPAPGGIGTDQYGCREPILYAEGSSWWLQYDGWDSAGATVRSVVGPRLALSTDRGLTWTRLGPDASNNLKVAGGTYACGSATGWLTKFGTTYYRVRVTVPNLATGTLAQDYSPQLGGSGNTGDLWSAPSPLGPWSPVLDFAPTSGGWNDLDMDAGSILFDGSTYHLFTAGWNSGSTATAIGRYHATSPSGPWTADPTPIFSETSPPLSAAAWVENPRVFQHTPLGVYVLVANLPYRASVVAESTLIGISASLTDWSGAKWRTITIPCPMDGMNTIGTLSHLAGPGNAAILGPGGEVPVVYDTDADRYADLGYQAGRRIRSAVLEPFASCLHYAGSGDTTQRAITRPLAHADLVVEFAVEAATISVGGGSTSVNYRDDGSGNLYSMRFPTAGPAQLFKVVAGSSAQVATGTGIQAFGSRPNVHRIKLAVAGNTHRAYVDGELQLAYTDASSPIASGVQLGLAGYAADLNAWGFAARPSDVVTVTGLTPGAGCVVRSYGGLPAGSVVADASGSGTFTIAHYPLWSLDVGGVDYTPTGGIWGGDTLAFSGLPASSAAAIAPLTR